MFIRSKQGQSTLEYVILVGFVVAALIAMGIYMKRAFQGRLRESSDQVGQQYSAGLTTSNYSTVSNTSQVDVLNSGATTTTIQTNIQTKTGSENVASINSEDQ